jgi:hypothetical protein
MTPAIRAILRAQDCAPPVGPTAIGVPFGSLFDQEVLASDPERNHVGRKIAAGIEHTHNGSIQEWQAVADSTECQ